jgi:isopentenyl diphosphate isomerase/L-lactate dehydrogenase-like FMN-dependent dehydrogenase
VGAQQRITLTDVEALASERLDPHWREYFAGGAGSERTLRENVSAYSRYRLRQRVLCGIESVSTAVTVLGHELSAPLIVAPVAYMRRAHPDGEEGMARAAAAVGAGMCLSTFATVSADDVARAAPDVVRFLQVYVYRDRGLTDEVIAMALDAGFTGLFLTVDLPVLGARDREMRINWVFPEDDLPMVVYARERGLSEHGSVPIDPSLDWAYLERLCTSVAVPVVAKGILEAEDARLAVEHGVRGVVVSNHGGRQLDAASPTLEALPSIAEAVGDRVEVFVDGGIRRGSDVATALALGARAVLVGRAPLWGLAAGGEEGAKTVLRLMREELEVALHLMGCRSLEEVGAANVSRVGAG